MPCANVKWRACLSSFSTSEPRVPRSAVTHAPSPVAPELLPGMRLVPCSVNVNLEGCVSTFRSSGAHKTSCRPSLAVRVCARFDHHIFHWSSLISTPMSEHVTILSRLFFATLIRLIRPWRPMTGFSRLIVLWELDHLTTPGTDHCIYSWWLSNTGEHSVTSPDLWNQSHTPSDNRQMEGGTRMLSLAKIIPTRKMQRLLKAGLTLLELIYLFCNVLRSCNEKD